MFPVSWPSCLKHQCLLFSTPELSVALQVLPQSYTGITQKCRKVSTLEEQYSVRSNHLPSGRGGSEPNALAARSTGEGSDVCSLGLRRACREPPRLGPSSLSTFLFLLPGVTQVPTSGPAFGKTQTKMGIFLSSCYVKTSIHRLPSVKYLPMILGSEIWTLTLYSSQNHVSFLCAESHRKTSGWEWAEGRERNKLSCTITPTTSKTKFFICFVIDWKILSKDSPICTLSLPTLL